LLLAALVALLSGCGTLLDQIEPTFSEEDRLIGSESLTATELATTGFVLINAAKFYATGGPDPNHAFKGVDAFFPTRLYPRDPIDRCPYRRTYGGSATVELWLWHTGDWVAFHVPDPGFPYIVEICMGDGGSKPAFSRPVRVWRDPDPDDPDRAGGHDNSASGTKLCEIEVKHSGRARVEKAAYICDSPAIQGEHMIVIELEDGEFIDSHDRNLLIDWIKLVPTGIGQS
jgi:hypothetical protein